MSFPFTEVVGRAGEALRIAAVSQGDGTGALSVSGSVSSAPSRSTTQTVNSVPPLTTVQTLSAANANRLAWTVYNASAGFLFLSFNASGAPAFATVPSGANYALPVAATQAIYGVFSTANGSNAIVTDYSP